MSPAVEHYPPEADPTTRPSTGQGSKRLKYVVVRPGKRVSGTLPTPKHRPPYYAMPASAMQTGLISSAKMAFRWNFCLAPSRATGAGANAAIYLLSAAGAVLVGPLSGVSVPPFNRVLIDLDSISSWSSE